MLLLAVTSNCWNVAHCNKLNVIFAKHAGLPSGHQKAAVITLQVKSGVKMQGTEVCHINKIL